MPIEIRAATADDQEGVVALVRSERVNPKDCTGRISLLQRMPEELSARHRSGSTRTDRAS